MPPGGHGAGDTLARVVDVSVRDQPGERILVPFLCGFAAAGILAAAWLLLERRPEAAGWTALGSGTCLVLAGVLLRPADRRIRVLLSFADRAFDGCVLGSLAWILREERPSTAAAALVALAAGFLASYIRARGGSLGYGIEEGIVTPVLRYGLLSLALVFGWMPWAVWVVAALTLLAAAVRSSQVAKEERL